MSGFKGDPKALAKIAKELRELPTVINETAVAVAPVIQAKIEHAVASGRDPYGKGYAPLKAGGGTPLQGMGEPAKVRATGTTVTASVTRKVPRFHQRGRSASAKTGLMPVRAVIPHEGQPLPEEWEKALKDTANTAISKRFK